MDTSALEQGIGRPTDVDPGETQEWAESIRDVIDLRGRARARYLLGRQLEVAEQYGAGLPRPVSTPYVNTIPAEEQPEVPGDSVLERRVRAYLRWNAVVMVLRANAASEGLGGHLSTYASSASLYEIGFNHFFRGKDDGGAGDQVFFQGHASPGIYARAFLEGRIGEEEMDSFRREVDGGGLSSYPHPRLMPEFWEFPTVSMGLGPLNAVYQARFNRYLANRGIVDTSASRVWCFLGDGECDEPESLTALPLAAREGLDNLVFVINCNLQRLDGPVRGNGKVIQELEGVFRGAGWNVIKVIWGSDWDPILAADVEGVLVDRLNTTLDGDFQRCTVEPGSFIRQRLFGDDPRLQALVEHLSDEDLAAMRRGGHDDRKLYAAYRKATEHQGAPSVILVKTVKGWALGPEIEGRNSTTRSRRWRRPSSGRCVTASASPKRSPTRCSTADCRRTAGRSRAPPSASTCWSDGGSSVAPSPGASSCPPPSACPTPPASPTSSPAPAPGRSRQRAGMQLSYRESPRGQILQEGITEAGAMASFTAAATSYATWAQPMIPFYIFYSMFGFQRTGDAIWACGDMRGRGFLCGATAGRTTLNGEGLQHEDGHSLLLASTVPNLAAYDPAFAYEMAVIVQHGIDRMFGDNPEDVFYYLTLYNENYPMPPMPEAPAGVIEEGIRRGMYRFAAAPEGPKRQATILFSGSAQGAAREAQQLLADDHDVAAELWSVPSYKALREDAQSADRWNRLHPTEPARVPYVTEQLLASQGPLVAVSDYMQMVPDQVARWVPGHLTVLGTDGYGRSDTRAALRRHFGTDAAHVVVAVLKGLVDADLAKPEEVADAIAAYGIDPESVEPRLA